MEIESPVEETAMLEEKNIEAMEETTESAWIEESQADVSAAKI